MKSKLPHVGTTIPLRRDKDVFTVMSKLNEVKSREAGLAAECGTINLSPRATFEHAPLLGHFGLWRLLRA